MGDDVADASVADVLAELQGAFAQADTELELAVARVSGVPQPAPPAIEPTTTDVEWSRVSRMLQHAGFAPLALRRTDDGFAPTSANICEVFTTVLAAYERQQDTVQQSLEEAAGLAQQVTSTANNQQVQADEELIRANAALEAQLEVARGRLRAQTEEAEQAASAAERALGGLRAKMATQAHQLKAKEAETQRLQERLSKELAELDAAQKQRERQVFQEVHKRAARPHSAADSRGLELISVYEAQRRTTQTELDEVRADNAQLSAELTDARNLIARKDALRSWRTPDEGELLGKLNAAQAGEREARLAVQQMEGRAAEQLRAARATAAELRRDLEAEKAHVASLELDLSARPTVKQYTDAQATIETLRRALPSSPQESALRRHAHAAATPPAADGAGPPRHPAVDSADAIRRDREVYELGLLTVQSLPPTEMIKLLQDTCRELQLSDPNLLPAAVRKMCRALAALPPMESFIREVCAVALSRGAPAGAETKVPSTKLVLQILKTWAVELRELQQYVDFSALLSELLRKRTLPGGKTGGMLTKDAKAASVGVSMPLRDITFAVEELVGQERKSMRALDTFERADAYVDQQLKLDPSDLTSKLIAHFRKLFDVKSAEGVIPKMNELYLFANQQFNLNKVLKSMVGLKESASTHQLLAAIREALDLANDPNQPLSAAPAADAPAADAPAAAPAGEEKQALADPDAKRLADADAKRMGAASAEADGAPPKTLPQYIAIAAELRRLVRVESVLDVVPAVKELMRQLYGHKQARGQMEVLIEQLCATLAIGSAEAVIAERMQQALNDPPTSAE